MKEAPTSLVRDSLYFRLTLWSCRQFAHGAIFLSNVVLFLARPLPAGIKQRLESSARLLKNMATLTVRPHYIRTIMKPGTVLKSTLDGFFIGAPLGIIGAYYLPDNNPIAMTIAVLTLLIIILFFTTLISFLSLSGDIYVHKQDEFQKALSNEAGAYTLRIVIGLLILLFLSDLFWKTLRTDIIAHLCIVFFLTRIVYMCKLTQLRWQEMLSMDLDEDNLK